MIFNAYVAIQNSSHSCHCNMYNTYYLVKLIKFNGIGIEYSSWNIFSLVRAVNWWRVISVWADV